MCTIPVEQVNTLSSSLAYFTLQNMLQSFFGYFPQNILNKKTKQGFLHSGHFQQINKGRALKSEEKKDKSRYVSLRSEIN